MKLRADQQAALDWCLRTPRGYLAARAGSGKTGVALAYASVMLNAADCGQVLVIAPKRVVRQWAWEARKWPFSASLVISSYVGSHPERRRAVEARSDVLVVSFEHLEELVRRYPAASWPFGLVVFDEASRLRNGGRQGSKTWKIVDSISRQTNARILLMSGSPRPGSGHELFAPVFLLDRGERLGRTLTAFREQWCEPASVDRRTGQVWRWELKPGREPLLYKALASVMRVCNPDLGLESIEIDRLIELPAGVMRQYRALARDQVIDVDDLELSAGSEGVLAGKLHQMAQGAVFSEDRSVADVHREKLDELEGLVEELDEPVIICYWYTHDLARLKALFPRGRTLDTERDIKDAREGLIDVLFLHPASAGHGIDGLQRVYSALIWYCLPHSFELYEQACARMVRIGRVGTARIYRLIAVGTIDERIVQRLEEKRQGQNRLFEALA